MSVYKVSDINRFLGLNALHYLHELLNQVDTNDYQIGKWKFFSEDICSKCVILNKSSETPEIMEYHKEYSDIHITLLGRDKMLVGGEVSEIVQDYSRDSDFGLVKVENFKEQLISKGEFILLEPEIPHVNLLEPGSIKVVFKIKNTND